MVKATLISCKVRDYLWRSWFSCRNLYPGQKRAQAHRRSVALGASGLRITTCVFVQTGVIEASAALIQNTACFVQSIPDIPSSRGTLLCADVGSFAIDEQNKVLVCNPSQCVTDLEYPRF